MLFAIGIIKSKMMICGKNKGRLGLEKGFKNLRIGIPEIKCCLGNTRVGGRMISKWVFKTLCVGVDLIQVAGAVSSEQCWKTQ